jgi:hypothetical protein
MYMNSACHASFATDACVAPLSAVSTRAQMRHCSLDAAQGMSHLLQLHVVPSAKLTLKPLVGEAEPERVLPKGGFADGPPLGCLRMRTLDTDWTDTTGLNTAL